MKIPCKDGEFTVSELQIETWQAAYPKVDVLGEIRRAAAWADANPAKRKTVRGAKRFVLGWLNRHKEGSPPTGGMKRDAAPVLRANDQLDPPDEPTSQQVLRACVLRGWPRPSWASDEQWRGAGGAVEGVSGHDEKNSRWRGGEA